MGPVSGWNYLRLYCANQKVATGLWSIICSRCLSSLEGMENRKADSSYTGRRGKRNIDSPTRELVDDLIMDFQPETEKIGQKKLNGRSLSREHSLSWSSQVGFRDRGARPRWESRLDREHRYRRNDEQVNEGNYDVGQKHALWAVDGGRLDRKMPQNRYTDRRSVRLTDEDKTQTNFRSISREDFLSGVPYDMSPERFREALTVPHLWRRSFEDPDRIWDDLMESMKNRRLWEASYKHLVGAAQVKEILGVKKKAAAAERGIRALQAAVVSGEFRWQGESKIYIRGEVKNALERRALKAAVKRAEEEKDESFLASMQHHFQDRLVQEVLRVVLEPVFEPSFAIQSHGFRIGRSQLSAFQQIRFQFQNCNWVFRTNLCSLYDLVVNDRDIFRDRLKGLLDDRIEDDAFLDLLISGIDAHSIMGPEVVEPMEAGVSPLSSKSGIAPLLCNIYFDRFDKWLKKRSMAFNKGATRRFNPERLALLKNGQLKLAQQTAILDPFDPNFRRMAFCRYADDFCVAIGGTRPEATALVEDIYEFLEADLHLTLPEGVKILNMISKPVPFLGHLLQKREVVPEKKERMQVLRAHAQACQKQWNAEETSLRRANLENGTVDKEEVVRRLEYVHVVTKSGQVLSRDDIIHASIRRVLTIDGDTDKMHRLLAKAGFCHKDGTPIPNFRFMHLTQNETNENVRKTLFGICDYLRAARNRVRLVHYVSDMLRQSLAKMFAAKFKLQSRRKVFKRGGKALAKWIKAGNPPAKNAVDEVDMKDLPREDQDVLAAIPFVRGTHVPYPDLSHLPLDWEPPMIRDLKDRVCNIADK